MKIAVVGDVLIDEYVYGSVERISPEAPVPILKYSSKSRKLGGAGNVYENIKSLTPNVIMCTTADDYPVKTRFIADGHYLLRVDNDINANWTTKLDSADIIVVSDYNKGSITADLLQSLSGKVIVDPKKHLSAYSGCWCVKPNKREFEQSMGKWDNTTDLQRLMQLARSTYTIEHLIVTLGEHGVAYCGPESFAITPSQAREVFDVTGAGDTFTAVLAYGIASDMSMMDAITLANKAAGIAVSYRGTYIIKPEDIGIGQTTVFTNGCFDILHRGHIEYLKKSKALGDRLVVGLNSDASVKRLKGKGRPINTASDRKYILESLPFVDEVVVFDEDTPYNLIQKIRPNFITKGGDYNPDGVVGCDLAKVVIIPYVDGQSTTSIIERANYDKTDWQS